LWKIPITVIGAEDDPLELGPQGGTRRYLVRGVGSGELSGAVPVVPGSVSSAAGLGSLTPEWQSLQQVGMGLSGQFREARRLFDAAMAQAAVQLQDQCGEQGRQLIADIDHAFSQVGSAEPITAGLSDASGYL